MSPLDSFIQPALAKRGFWRVVLGLLMILFFWIVGMVAILSVWTIGKLVSGMPLEAAMLELGALQQGGRPIGIVIMLLSFAGIWVGVFLALVTLHSQRFGTIFAPRGAGMLRDFGKGLAMAILATLPQIIIGMQIAEPIPGLPPSEWLLWVVPVLLFVFIQATGEELVFRGYLLQQLAGRTRSWIIWAFLPSFIFGLLHYGDRAHGADYYYIAVTTISGLTFCALVWRSGSLMPAIGLHVGINGLALTLIGPQGPLGGTQLFLFPEEAFLTLLQMSLVVSVLMLAFVLSPLGRVFEARP